MEKIVKIQWEGKEEEVTLKQLTWGDHKKCREQSIVIKDHNRVSQQFRNIDLLDDLKIVCAIKKAPFEPNMNNLDKISFIDRNKLLLEVLHLEGEDVA